MHNVYLRLLYIWERIRKSPAQAAPPSLMFFVVVAVCEPSGNQPAVRFCDGTTRLLLIRVPREFCSRVRASLTLLLSTAATALSQLQPKKAVWTVLAVRGSARTAKVEAIRHVRLFYRQRLVAATAQWHNDNNNNDITPNGGNMTAKSRKETDRICRSMVETLDVIINIDY